MSRSQPKPTRVGSPYGYGKGDNDFVRIFEEATGQSKATTHARHNQRLGSGAAAGGFEFLAVGSEKMAILVSPHALNHC